MDLKTSVTRLALNLDGMIPKVRKVTNCHYVVMVLTMKHPPERTRKKYRVTGASGQAPR